MGWKPFGYPELKARIGAVLHPNEFALLRVLANDPTRAFSESATATGALKPTVGSASSRRSQSTPSCAAGGIFTDMP